MHTNRRHLRSSDRHARRRASVLFGALSALVLVATCASPARAAGTLTPVGAGQEPMCTVDHRVQVSIDNGGTPSIGWQLLAYVVLTSGEVMVSITCTRVGMAKAAAVRNRPMPILRNGVRGNTRSMAGYTR